jgi:amino acid adenylation domain-containing protein
MSLLDRVLHHARGQPDRLAVRGPDGDLTYGELDRLAARWAGVLADWGIVRGDRVVLHLPKSARAVAMMQAVLRLGAVYVPIDPSSPAGRVDRILRHCRASLVIGGPGRMSASQLHGVPALSIDDLRPGPPREEPVTIHGHDPAYILYTSGSTGDPKGVCLSHGNAESFVDWVVETIRPSPSDRFANHASFQFDLSVLDLYAALHAGASVHLIPETLSFAPSKLNRWLVDERITVWYSVPSVLLMMMAEDDFPDASELHLRVLFFAGEPFPVKPLRRLWSRWGSRARFFNLYGPTETNVCTAYEVRNIPEGRRVPVPIGSACSGDRVWAEHPSGRPVEIGEAGQLMVAGPSVMLGYWGEEPWGGKPYPTGDQVRRVDEWNYEYLGRLDHMVKVRGFRIELGAIEAVLELHPQVERAVVVVEGEGLEARLVAYLAAGGEVPGLIAIKRHCAEHLPPYMIVDRVRFLPGLPLNGNGKVDRRSLGHPVGAGGADG